ncbi:MAG: methyltransferase domain-containing protein [Simkaniaceae bacterium]|nr:methyltransferase domain-containing protein [Simkaniaceae bacterium]
MKKVVLAVCVACGLFAGSQEAAIEAATRGYEVEFIDLVEWVYGKGFLSQGGAESVEELVAPFDLDGKKVLDIGSGLGGPAITLAKNHHIDVIGIEPQTALVEKAQEYLEETDLQGSVEFIVIEDPSNLKIFEDSSFDYIISKEVILHIPTDMKEAYFKEIFRVLKPGGEIAILDWTHKSSNYSDDTKKMIELDGVAYNLITPIEYLSTLSKAGFSKISLEDTTQKHIELTNLNLSTIESLREKITTRYDDETYNFCMQSWTLQKNAFATRELATGIFRARK